ncbi:MAG: citrate/2-methylcitrate synthase [Solirubrobacteraceae bacterium]
MSTDRILSTAEVARRLGVRRETVYAYVSRGLLERHSASGHRKSLFDAGAVEALAGRARRSDRSGALEVVIETQITALDPEGRLFFRGRDAVELAKFRSFEQVAGLLWDGDPNAPWELDLDGLALLARLRAAVGAPQSSVDLIPVVVAALGAADAHRVDRRPNAVRRAGGRILAGALEILGADAPPANRSTAARLWAALRTDGRAARPAQLAALNSALVLMADHELAASTLAARVAASAWADPYRVVLAGLGPLGGTLHGADSTGVEAILSAATNPSAAFAVLEERLKIGRIPGFGHRIYRDRDPRADHLIGRITAAADGSRPAQTVPATLDAAAALGLPAPNADFALAALTYAMGLSARSAETIFTVARIAGIIAHAIEEYPHRLRFRPRATYVGEPRG